MLEQLAIEAVARADLDLVEAIEDVELGERQLGEAVQPNRLTQHHTIEPTGPPTPPGDRAELLADIDERVAVVIEQLGRERPGPDTRGVRLGDPDDPVDVAGPETGACARTAGGRVGRRHVRIGAVVEVEEGRLCTLQQHVCASGDRTVQQPDRVGDERGHARTEGAEAFDDVIHVERITTSLFDQRVLGDCPLSDEARKPLGIEHVAHPKTNAPRLVGVRRADALERCPDLVVASHRLGDGVVGLVPREDQVCALETLSSAQEMPRDSSMSISLNSVGRSTTTPLAITGITWS